MRALRLSRWGKAPELREVDRPVPGDGEVLVAVEAAGLCHSDLHVLDAAPGDLPFRLPFTLGHEVAGRVEQAGPLTDVTTGERVLVYGPWGCGQCGRCASGRENYCDRRADLGWAGMGLGLDGGMADYVLVPSARHLVPIGDLAASAAAPLSDAGLTPYHAIAPHVPVLDAESTVVVIGAGGGLGHLAVRLLRALTPSRVVAVDVRPEALALARSCGAHVTVLSTPDSPPELPGGVRADVVLDFVGSDTTLSLAARSVRAHGELVVVGSAGGVLEVRKPGALPPGCRVSLPFWGSRTELGDVVHLARTGALHAATESFPLSRAHEAIAALRSGEVRGRAVLIPD
jgi:propanol-preferring alcohol dehydrogenase